MTLWYYSRITLTANHYYVTIKPTVFAIATTIVDNENKILFTTLLLNN